MRVRTPTSPRRKTVSAFYEAANEPDGEKACSLLTADGIRAVVRVGSHAACVRTIDGFDPGSFSDDKGELLKIEDVEEHGDTTDVNALLKGRSGGVYTVVTAKRAPADRRFQAGRGLARALSPVLATA